MLDIIILATLVYLVLCQHTSEKEVKPYIQGRVWACSEYYGKGRLLEDLKVRVTRNLEPDDFERGALDAIKALEKRHQND